MNDYSPEGSSRARLSKSRNSWRIARARSWKRSPLKAIQPQSTKSTARRMSQNRSTLQALAERVGLDVGEFLRCVDSSSWEAELDRSVREARRLGVSETPTIFVNGRRLPQSATLDAMRAVVQDELSKLRR